MSRLIRPVVLSLLTGLLPVLGLSFVGPASTAATTEINGSAANGRQAPATAAAVPPGTGGLFVPAAGRLVDTRRLSLTSSALRQWRAYSPGGVAGVPSSGVAAVQLTLSVLGDTGGSSDLLTRAAGAANHLVALSVDESQGTLGASNTVIVPLGSGGLFEVRVDGGSVDNYVIDIQGYFTAGQTAGGGYVPLLAPSRIVDTRSPGQLPQAPLAIGSTTTIDVTGGTVPPGATAAFVNLTVINPTAESWITPFAAGTTRPDIRFNFERNENTTFGTTVPLSADGKIALYIAHASANLIVDVAGYYTPPTEANGAAAFSAATADVGGVTVPAGQTATLTFAGGSSGVPAIGTGLEAVAANVRVRQTSSGSGAVVVWAADGTPDPGTSTVSYTGGLGDVRTGFTTVGLGSAGGVQIKNSGTAAISVSLTVQGWYSSPDAVVSGGQSITSRAVTLRASNVGVATGRPWVRYEYRTVDGVTTDPISVPPDNVTDSNDLHPNQTPSDPDGKWPVQAVGTSFASYVWDMKATFGPTVTKRSVQVRACYYTASTTPLGTPLCGAYWTVEYTAGEYAYTSASTPLGPGELALATGNFQLSAQDASITTALGNMSIGRTLRTLSPNAAADTPAAKIFGPGWVADLAGPDAGRGSLYVDASGAPGVLRFETPSGAVLVYQATSPTNAFPITYTGSGDTAGDGVVVTRTTASGITMLEPDGTRTTWVLPASSDPEADPPEWRVASVVETGAVEATTYRYGDSGDTKDRVTRIVAPRGKGISSCEDSIVDTTPGCRSLILAYGYPEGSGAPPDQRRLLSVTLSAPDIPWTTKLTQIASYEYNSDGRLKAVWNSQVTPALKTQYDYYTTGSAGRLKTVTPPGENPWTLVYDTHHRLSKVQREVPVGNPVSGLTNQTATTTVVYDVPRSGTGLPDLSTSATASWGQTTSRPVEGEAIAIFPPSHEPAGITPGTVDGTDWKYATINYLGANGRITNTAVNGAGGSWLIDSTQYSPQGAEIWSLDARNRAHALNPSADTDTYVRDTPTSAERADLLASVTVFDPLDPVKVTDTYGPTHPVQMPDGATIHAREHTSSTYDEGAPHNNIAPTGGPYRLLTTVTTAPYDVAANNGAGADVGDVATGAKSVTRYGYEAEGSMVGQTIAGTKWPEAPGGSDVPLNGWNLAQPTTTVIQMGPDPSSADLVSKTIYNPQGRVVEGRPPGDTAGTTSSTVKTLFWSSTASPTTCTGGDPSWEGLVCKTKTGNGADGFPYTVYEYNRYGEITKSQQHYSSTQWQIQTTAYDTAGRPTQTTLTSTGLPSSTPVEMATLTYDPDTGRLASQTTGTGSSAKIIATTQGPTGLEESYTDATGAATYFGYNKDGLLASIVEPKGATTIDYGSADEHRPLATTKRVASSPVSTDPIGASGSTDSSGNLDLQGTAGVLNFTGSYNTGGALSTQALPGGLTATTAFDNAGTTTQITYKKGTTTWGTFSKTVDPLGRTASTSNKLNGATISSQVYGYDPADRLVNVKDTVTDTGCTTRLYGFDGRSNRTSLTSHPAGAGGLCTTATTPVVVTSTYDAANRLTNQSNVTSGSYTYDIAGRTRTVPASDAQGIGGHTGATGQLNVTYYDNDLVASITQGTGVSKKTTTLTLDPTGTRFLTKTTTSNPDNPADATTTTVTNHYASQGDSPTWSTSDDGTNLSWTRNIPGIGGGIGAVTTGTGTSPTGTTNLQLTNLHGDVVATTPADGTGTAINDYNETTEYGVPRAAANAKLPYGWLGAAQRDADVPGGIILMGLRLYNPSTGLFLSEDPIPGGNTTPYGYPQNPIDHDDTSGAYCPPCIVVAPVISVTAVVVSVGTGVVAAALIIAGVKLIISKTEKHNGYTVPFPGPGLNRSGKNYKVYVIKYRKYAHDIREYVWKYGISRQAGDARPNSQLPKCKADMKSPVDCRAYILHDYLSHYDARALEAHYIYKYLLQYGKCPPGHNGYRCT